MRNLRTYQRLLRRFLHGDFERQEFGNNDNESKTSFYNSSGSFFVEFTDLHPHPYLYGKLPQKEIEGMANRWASFSDFTANAQWLDLYNKVKETIPQDTTGN